MPLEHVRSEAANSMHPCDAGSDLRHLAASCVESGQRRSTKLAGEVAETEKQGVSRERLRSMMRLMRRRSTEEVNPGDR